MNIEHLPAVLLWQAGRTSNSPQASKHLSASADRMLNERQKQGQKSHFLALFGRTLSDSEWLIGKGVDIVYSPKGFKGKGPGYVFSDGGIDVVVTEDRSLENVMRSFRQESDIRNHS